MITVADRRLKVLAIQNYGPSGTMLLHSLLDGHPQLLTLPGLYPIGIYTGWRSFMASLAGSPTMDQITAFLMNWIRPLHDVEQLEASWGLTELGDDHNSHCCVAAGDLRTCLEAALAELGVRDVLAGSNPAQARRIAVTALFVAYSRCLGRDVRGATTLVYPAHSSEIQDLRDLAEDFPDIQCLHMVRDPVDGLFSTVKHNRNWQRRFPSAAAFDPFACAIVQMTADRTPLIVRREPFHALRPFDPALANRSRAVRLEDLHRAPEATMRAVADWAGLLWDGALVESTFAGKKWWNRPGLRRLSGFSESMATTDGVPSFDRIRIAAVTAPVRRRYRYARPGWFARLGDLLALTAVGFPFAMEHGVFQLRRYLATRFAIFKGAWQLRRQRDWVELLNPSSDAAGARSESSWRH